MKKKLLFSAMIGMGIISCIAVCQELIKPKAKKVYVSEQQDIELDGDIVVSGTAASGALIELSKMVFLAINASLTRVNEYACGQKGCLGKVERTDRYEKKVKIKAKIEEAIAQIEGMSKQISLLIAALDE
jgi:hypothetical protein